MFIHNILKILEKENILKFDIPIIIMNKILNIVKGIKDQSFRLYNNGKSKTCFFNHHHYNLLFLHLNGATIKLLNENK